VPPRVAILPPVPVPYREPLFERLAERGRVAPHVVYLSGVQAGWDQPGEWFPAKHSYSNEALRSWQRARPGRSPVTVARGIGRALSGAKPDCVVTWEFGPATWRALAWGRRRGVPVVVFSELTPWSDMGLSRPQLRVHRALAPRVAGMIAASSQAAERAGRLGVSGERVAVALQAADIEAVAGAARRSGAAAGADSGGDRRAVRVLAVGRLVPDKNFETLVAAFADAGFEEGEAELELRGSGPLESALRAQAERLGVPARFPDPVPPARLGEVYAAADALALVSTYEPFGVTLREGAAAGLPLIASVRAGATGDVAVEGENALVLDPTDRAAITGALRRVVREPALREQLAAGSRAVTQRHPLEADVEAWERAILRVTGASR
jgi:GalNAc-alpha-(1->4)-GalNAc-alpha-(1->3)-diNAcBac-PP-undecaprenol alpha-1,4-N-acetyl-D-galactosaminyltransferase